MKTHDAPEIPFFQVPIYRYLSDDGQKLETRLENLAQLQTACEAKLIVAAERAWVYGRTLPNSKTARSKRKLNTKPNRCLAQDQNSIELGRHYGSLIIYE